jgi:hypothetical protein
MDPLVRAYQRAIAAHRPTTPEEKRAWSAYVAEREQAKKAADPEGYRARLRGRTAAANAGGMNAHRQRRANRKRRAVIDEIKAHAGCKDCGRKDLPPCCYDFDHLDGSQKSFPVGVNMRRGAGAILDEIAKCEVVCANCHRVRTVSRLAPLIAVTEPEPFIDHVGRVTDLRALAVARGLL